MSKVNKIVLTLATFLVLILGIVYFINNKKDKTITYTVLFNADGGSTVQSQIVDAGNTASLPSEPTKEGYKFVGWENNGKIFDFSTPLNESVILKAVWEKDDSVKEKITIKFDSNGGTTIANQVINKGSIVARPVNPSKNGYTFVEWQLNNKKFDFNTKLTEDTTLTALWEKSSSTTNNNTSASNSNSNSNNNSNANNASSSNTNANTNNSSNSESIKKVLVGDVNGDGVVNTLDALVIKKYVNNISQPTPANISAGDVNKDGAIDEIDALIIQKYAVELINELPFNSGNKYSVNYDLNGGNIDKSSLTYKYGQFVGFTLSAKPTKIGYVFRGWTGSNGSNPQKEIKVESGSTGNKTYKANWALYGDVNLDGVVNTLDALAIRKYVAKQGSLVCYDAGDVNLDGAVNDKDAEIIQKYAAELIDKLPYNG